jgi:hypothetical protein
MLLARTQNALCQFLSFWHNSTHAKLRFHLSASISVFVRVDTSAMFSLLHIFTDSKYSTPSPIKKTAAQNDDTSARKQRRLPPAYVPQHPPNKSLTSPGNANLHDSCLLWIYFICDDAACNYSFISFTRSTSVFIVTSHTILVLHFPSTKEHFFLFFHQFLLFFLTAFVHPCPSLSSCSFPPLFSPFLFSFPFYFSL